MQNLEKYIQDINQKGKMVYMPYITVGDPDFDASVEYAISMIDAGANIVELGIPFSDPTADGPVIQAAMVRAMSHPDFSIQKVFAVAGAIHKARPRVPLVLLSYANPVMDGFQVYKDQDQEGNLQNSICAFLDQCSENGVAGVVIPDLPFDTEESKIFRKESQKRNISQIMLIAPNTNDERMQAICNVASGFIYYVTSLGVTGVRSQLPDDLKERVQKIQKLAGVPVLAGFGISHSDHVKALKGVLNGVIVGSLNHRIIHEDLENAKANLAKLTSELAGAC